MSKTAGYRRIALNNQYLSLHQWGFGEDAKYGILEWDKMREISAEEFERLLKEDSSNGNYR